MAEPTYRWDDRTGRYRSGETGRFVSRAVVRAGVDNVVSAAAREMRSVTERFRTTDMPLGQWQREMMAQIKAAHIATALTAIGGRDQATQATWGRVGAIVYQQYLHLNKFAGDILDGRQRLNGRADMRAAMYAEAARATFEQLQRSASRLYGYTFERNVLHARESCTDCVAQSMRGSVPIGTLTPIGARRCMSMCKCTLDYSKKFLPQTPAVVTFANLAEAS